jgi:hypothetical protein
MDSKQSQLVAKQMLLNIDTTMKQLMTIRNEVEKIVNNCSKLQSIQAGVSTPALSDGATDAIIVKVLNQRAKTLAKKNNY